MKLITAGVSSFLLREQPFSAFDFPRWHAWLCVILVSIPYAFDPALTGAPSNMPDDALMPLWAGLILSVFSAVIITAVMVGVLRWWLKRGGRWDGQGSLLNLLVASTLVTNLFSLVGILLGWPMIVLMPLWLYGIWVNANAISGAIPGAGLGYSIAGLCISVALAFFIFFCMIFVATLAFALVGIVFLPEGSMLPATDI
ncbi:MAG: hypothetical protein Q4D19_00295 [Lautropia sp.]|nr:hypothetical protein [Lautropia sp.]